MSAPLAKVLIANRGEIAVRIEQTCRELGIATVAVYSTADAGALHVQRSDEAYCIGPAPALESYLRIAAILDVARRSGADAVHPGYGFLAENAGFARAVLAAGLIWIGPPPDVIALMGDKVAAKDLARKAGVPVVPGYAGEDQSVERLQSEAEGLGYPVMIKAAAGGGGKGMRVVERAADLPAALEGARREAQAAFGDNRIFLEKLILRPRHIEIQVLLDSHGDGVYLGERDCSIQRRHQKVVEESPSPIMTPPLRTAMGEAALRLARAGSYVNAGTVEFLFGADQYYFLEMNTRIQVEHPVTEMITGRDLIRLQLEVAAGRRLGFGQLDVDLRGHAIEARLYAEDARHGFLPATGTLQIFQPPQGPGIRNDVGVYAGSEITPFYDPMLAKLVVHAETRGAAIARLRDALSRYAALGVTTNLGFLHWISEQPDFRAGRVDTGWVHHAWQPDSEVIPREVLLAAAAFQATADSAMREQAIDGDSHRDRFSPWRQSNEWRPFGMGRAFVYEAGGTEYRVTAEQTAGSAWRLGLDDETLEVTIEHGGPGHLILREGTRILPFVIAAGETLAIEWQGSVYTLRPSTRFTTTASHTPRTDVGLAAPMPGTVVKVEVTAGQRVSAHETLVVMEAMKMEHVIQAPYDAIVRDILFGPGDMVPAGAAVVDLEPQ